VSSGERSQPDAVHRVVPQRLTGSTIAFRTWLTLATDQTVDDRTSEYLVYRGLVQRYRSEDGSVLAVRRGQFRLDRSGDVMFEAGDASRVIDISPYVA
jgi:hypothetical protein